MGAMNQWPDRNSNVAVWEAARMMILASLLWGFAHQSDPGIGSTCVAGRDNGRESFQSRVETGPGV